MVDFRWHLRQVILELFYVKAMHKVCILVSLPCKYVVVFVKFYKGLT